MSDDSPPSSEEVDRRNIPTIAAPQAASGPRPRIMSASVSRGATPRTNQAAVLQQEANFFYQQMRQRESAEVPTSARIYLLRSARPILADMCATYKKQLGSDNPVTEAAYRRLEMVEQLLATTDALRSGQYESVHAGELVATGGISGVTVAELLDNESSFDSD